MEENEQKTETKNTFKNKLFLIGGLFAIAGVLAVYLWYQNTSNIRSQAQAVIESAEKYDSLKSAIEEESSRCESFIVQQEGNFGDFEYCQKFIQWANQNAEL